MRPLLVVLGLAFVLPARAETPPRREACGPPDGAALAIKLAFSDLVNIHRARVPGPGGQRILDERVEELLRKTVDLERFAAMTLTPMWDGLDADKRAAWAADLLAGLRGLYLRRLTGDRSPIGQRLDVLHSHAECDEAKVDLTVGPRVGRRRTEVLLRMTWTGLAWRAWDATVDGVSLLETWRNRFRLLYRDGGVAAVDEHLHELAERYRQP
ncbi:MAG: ABC transporter substrate-binding protein [Deltaproteobacteria bacterium]|nr:ABC transporter substrate-binding protein [Deltaproteobacteria bacterium]